MAIATPMVSAARSLIKSFGNDATLYTYLDAIKLSNDEGEDSIQSWAVPVAMKVVDGGSHTTCVTVSLSRSQWPGEAIQAIAR